MARNTKCLVDGKAQDWCLQLFTGQLSALPNVHINIGSKYLEYRYALGCSWQFTTLHQRYGLP